jgi:hypothetical protein
MSQELETGSRFVRRLNPDGTVDSICKSCTEVVAHESDELKLDESEAQHFCLP